MKVNTVKSLVSEKDADFPLWRITSKWLYSSNIVKLYNFVSENTFKLERWMYHVSKDFLNQHPITWENKIHFDDGRVLGFKSESSERCGRTWNSDVGSNIIR